MLRLINADKLKDTISDTWILDRIDEQPAIDAVEVVRCKDCVMLQFCRFAQGLGLDGFCSQGERKNEIY